VGYRRPGEMPLMPRYHAHFATPPNCRLYRPYHKPGLHPYEIPAYISIQYRGNTGTVSLFSTYRNYSADFNTCDLIYRYGYCSTHVPLNGIRCVHAGTQADWRDFSRAQNKCNNTSSLPGCVAVAIFVIS